jgi:uncharacterized protein
MINMKVLVDTGVFISFFDSTDDKHEEAVLLLQEIEALKISMFVSDYILDELWTRMLYDAGDRLAIKVMDILQKDIKEQKLGMLFIDKTIFESSIDVFKKYSEHIISFTDCTTYSLYQYLHFDEIITFDRDFKKLRVKVRGV